ncbi:MAG TPA: hypothetical protein VLZ89_07180 [Anaerolineales bacterium]|nr:hypothetical protein [Anaerolineales bacterium]
MTRLIITAIHREAAHRCSSGSLYVLDFEDRKLLMKTDGIEPPYRLHDQNPRGGMRGMRGLGVRNGELAVANYSSVFFFDPHWNLLRTLTHPSVAAIHEILYVDDGIWVSSTANDLLAKFDLAGQLMEFEYVRSHKNLMRQLGGPWRPGSQQGDAPNGKFDLRKRTYFKSDAYDRTHLNSMTFGPDGRLFISLGLIVGDSFSFLVILKGVMISLHLWKPFLSLNRLVRSMLRLEKKMLSELVVQPARGRSAVISTDLRGDWRVHLLLPTLQNPSHSARILDDGTGLYLDTSHGTLIHFDPNGDIISNTRITEKFLRGLLVLSDGQLAIGTDNLLLVFNLQKGEVVSEIEITKDPRITIFDVQVLPPEFELPPDSLESRTGRIAGFANRNILWEKGRA